ncbi:MAG: phenylacetate--CoA ligase family protein [Pirellulaceae bacterium]|nr:phenylacetate--CoA ligase family protein [Pirellulaceae bacterium]
MVLNRGMLEARQLERLNALLSQVRPQNQFYEEKFANFPRKIESLKQWQSFPLTTKTELSSRADENGLAPHHTFPLQDYLRFHRTSGSTGRPLVILDRAEDWNWWIHSWQFVLDAAKIEAGTTVLMAFSFGPFIGFWSANDACLARRCRVVPGGGLSTVARLDLMQSAACSVLFSTPSYTLHLADEAAKRGIDATKLGIRKIFVAGEPGGSIPAIRKRIETAFDATLFDHAGATEVGPWGIGTPDGLAIQVNENEFIAEFLPCQWSNQGIDIASPSTAVSTEVKELVLTTLGRAGVPALRYRTGDIVRPNFEHDEANGFVRLEGGVLGRTDQMMTIRAVNVFPSSIDTILHAIPEIGEFRLIASREGAMDQLTIEVEDSLHDPVRIADLLNRRLGLRVEVVEVEQGSLPRSIDKAKRFIDTR